MKKEGQIVGLEIAEIFLRVLEKPRIVVISNDFQWYLRRYDDFKVKPDVRFRSYAENYDTVSSMVGGPNWCNLMIIDHPDLDPKVISKEGWKGVDMYYLRSKSDTELEFNKVAIMRFFCSHFIHTYPDGTERLYLFAPLVNDEKR